MKFKYIFYTFLSIYIIVQLIFLAHTPLPWFDETFFASMSESFSKSASLKPKVAFFEEVKIYGFVYFFLVSISFKVFGFGIWSFRLTNFLAALACIWIFRKILIKNLPQTSKLHINLAVSLIIFDPFLNLSWHEGRMDLTALFFALLSLFYLQNAFKSKKYQDFIFSSIAISLALLTTPRIGFILLAMVLIGIFFFFQNIKKHWKYCVLWSIVLLGIYQIWVIYAFGSWQNLWFYYTNPQKVWINASSPQNLYLGFNGYIPRQTYPLISFAILSLLYTLFFYATKYANYLIVIGLLSILLFYNLVFDYGPYSIFILFFYYFFLFYALFFKKISWQNPIIYLVFLLLSFNLAYSSLKNLQIFASFQQRNFTKVDKFIQKNIPKNSKVIGEPMYYYSVRKAESDYQYFDLYETLESREKRQREVYKYDYLIITEHIAWRKPDVVKYYLQKAKFKEVAKFSIPRSGLSLWIDKLGLVSNIERFGYNATIYKRIKE